MRKCPCAKWRDLKDRIIAMQLDMFNEPIVMSLNEKEREKLIKQTTAIVGQVELDSRAIEMTTADFRKIRTCYKKKRRK